MTIALLLVGALLSALIGGVIASLIVIDSLRRANAGESGHHGTRPDAPKRRSAPPST